MRTSVMYMFLLWGSIVTYCLLLAALNDILGDFKDALVWSVLIFYVAFLLVIGSMLLWVQGEYRDKARKIKERQKMI